MGIFLMLLLMLLPVVVLSSSNRYALVLSAVNHVDGQQLQKAYLRYMYSPKSLDYVALIADGSIVLDWTLVREVGKVTEAIRGIGMVQIICPNWANDLRTTASLAVQPTTVYLITNGAACSPLDAFQASRELQVRNVRVYPVGVGSNVTDAELEAIAGPCHNSFGCLKGWHYLHTDGMK